MLVKSLTAGLTVSDFWNVTPWELNCVFRAHNDRRRGDYEDRVELAWNIAALVWQKKLPPLKKLLGKDAPAKLTAAELKARREEHEQIVKLMSEKLGNQIPTR